MGDGGIEFTEGRTQWNKSPEPIVVEFSLVLSRKADPALSTFVERIASLTLEGESPALTMRYTTSPDDSLQNEPVPLSDG